MSCCLLHLILCMHGLPAAAAAAANSTNTVVGYQTAACSEPAASVFRSSQTATFPSLCTGTDPQHEYACHPRRCRRSYTYRMYLHGALDVVSWPRPSAVMFIIIPATPHRCTLQLILLTFTVVSASIRRVEWPCLSHETGLFGCGTCSRVAAPTSSACRGKGSSYDGLPPGTGDGRFFPLEFRGAGRHPWTACLDGLLLTTWSLPKSLSEGVEKACLRAFPTSVLTCCIGGLACSHASVSRVHNMSLFIESTTRHLARLEPIRAFCDAVMPRGTRQQCRLLLICFFVGNG